MRIIAGTMRGLKLADVGKGDAAAHLRPTSDRVRESLFNLLQNGSYGDPINGARVLDLFAGTGALGLEALSRGAAHVSFVENGKPALALLAENIARCRAAGQTEVIRSDATALASPPAPFNLIFLDPPYGQGSGEKALAVALQGGWIAPEALIVWEENTPPRIPTGLIQLDQRRYGETLITLLRLS